MIRATIGILAGTGRKPVALAATGVGETSFTANWEAFEGAVYYLLDVSTQEDFSTFVYENEIIYAPTTSYVVIGLEDNTTYYYRLRASTEPLYLLDEWEYPDAAAAYSLRKLRHKYKGAAVEVRNDGGVHLDIGFDENGDLDTAALLAHCGSGNGTVSTWYDQSGNGYDATQGTASDQPQIISSGSVILDNGKPSIQFNNSGFSPIPNTAGAILFHTSTTGTLYNVGNYQLNTGQFNIIVENNGTSSSRSGFVFANDDRGSNDYSYYQLTNNSGSDILFTNGSAFTDGRFLYAIHYDFNTGIFGYRNSSLFASKIQSETYAVGNATYDLSIGSLGGNTAYGLNGTMQELILYNQDDTNRTGIQTNINSHYQIYWDGSQTSLLDSYSGSAAAYSLRALNSAYTGPLVEVRNGSGVHADIYAKYDGSLNTDALLAHCGSGDGTVSTWYDQSGNGNDATQSTVANQPQIVSSGSVITLNSKPAIQADSTLKGFDVGQFTWSEGSISTVFNRTGRIGAFDSLWIFDGGEPYNQLYSTGSDWLYYSTGTYTTSIPLTTSQKLITMNDNGTATSFYDDSSLDSTFSISNNVSNLTLRLMYSQSRAWLGNMQEFIFWDSDQSSNRTGISNNINDFYSIYYVPSDSDAQAFVSRVQTAGGSLSDTEKESVNTLVSDLKDAGIWTKMKAIYPMVGGGVADPAAAAAACAQNLKSSSFTGSFSSGWSFASTGVTPNGTSAYMDTSLNPNSTMNFNSQSYIYYRGNVVTKGTEYGYNLDHPLDNYGTAFFPTLNYTYINSFITSVRLSGGVNAGNYIMTLNNSVLKVRKNSTLVGTQNVSVSNYASFPIFLGCRNEHGVSGRDFTDSECRFFGIGDGLTDTEASDFYDAVQAFQTTLSRNV